MKNTKYVAYAILRITMGLNIMGHGLARISKIGDFRGWIIETFKDSFLPSWSLYLWGTSLPILEFSIGLLTLLGLFTRQIVVAGALVMALLVFGSCIIEKWEWAGFQMIYALFYYFLIVNVDNDSYALDRLIHKNKTTF